MALQYGSWHGAGTMMGGYWGWSIINLLGLLLLLGLVVLVYLWIWKLMSSIRKEKR